ncbi:hypothetical protein ACYSTM_21205 [Bacillus licheniformis]|uniref:hypothetical protein n=1 Tax=Bacillus licheniformis TaxID=1402 RepID=UPI0011A925D7|nr:hypothetical protein [Bacillus licheniformis]
MDFQVVQDYIKSNMFYTEKWDELSEMEEGDRIKQVVVNNAAAILYRELPHHFNEERKPIPIDVLAEQCLHILEFDDSHRRAEMGVSYFMASGLYLSFDKNFKDRSVAKTILHRYPRRKSGRYVYSKPDTFRRY